MISIQIIKISKTTPTSLKLDPCPSLRQGKYEALNENIETDFLICTGREK